MVPIFLTEYWPIHIWVIISPPVPFPPTFLGISVWESYWSQWKITQITSITTFCNTHKHRLFCQALGFCWSGVTTTQKLCLNVIVNHSRHCQRLSAEVVLVALSGTTRWKKYNVIKQVILKNKNKNMKNSKDSTIKFLPCQINKIS